MFEIHLYNLKKKPDSTKRPTGEPVVMHCQSVTSFSILAPVFSFVLSPGTTPTNFNYAFVPKFGRYYFVEWSFSDGIWNAACTVDVLASFKNDIGSTTAYILRSSAASDGKVMDNTYPTKADPTRSIKNIDSLVSPIWNSNLGALGGYFSVGIASDGQTTYYLMNPNAFNQFIQDLFGPVYLEEVTGGFAGVFTNSKNSVNPLQYLTSCYWLPYVPQLGSSVSGVMVGYGAVSTSAYKITGAVHHKTYTIQLDAHPQSASRGEFLNYAPFTRNEIFVSGFGSVQIDSADVRPNEDMTIDIALDDRTGHGTMYIKNVSGAVIGSVSSQIGVPIQLSDVVQTGVGVQHVLGFVGAAASMATGNILGGITGAISAIGDAVESQIPHSTTSGSNGSLDALVGGAKLYQTFFELVDEDNDHRGRPLCQNRRIDSIPGFLLCADGDILTDATDAERSQIKSILEGGFFYE